MAAGASPIVSRALLSWRVVCDRVPCVATEAWRYRAMARLASLPDPCPSSHESRWLRPTGRRQRLEQDDEDAFWPAGQGCPAVRLLREGKVAVLSYRWLEQVDPDPQITTDVDALTPVHELGRGYHERALVGFLEMHPNFEAVFWDVLSLCQHPPGGRRNDDEEAMFHGGLEVMGSLYASPNTMVVQSTQLPPSHASLKPYALSGWCVAAPSPARTQHTHTTHAPCAVPCHDRHTPAQPSRVSKGQPFFLRQVSV